jgi:hypothetical protein
VCDRERETERERERERERVRIFVCGEREKGDGGGLCLLFVYLIYTIVNINAEVGLPGAHRKGGETEQTEKKSSKEIEN